MVLNIHGERRHGLPHPVKLSCPHQCLPCTSSLSLQLTNFKCQIGLGVWVDGHKILQLDIHIILYFEHITLPTLICLAQVQGGRKKDSGSWSSDESRGREHQVFVPLIE